MPEGPEVAQVIDDLVADGNDIIFATSFGFGEAMQAASEEYPDVAFEWATGIAPTDNMGIYFGAGEQSIYLAGMSAGRGHRVEHHRLRGTVPDPRGDPPHQRLHARRPVGEP